MALQPTRSLPNDFFRPVADVEKQNLGSRVFHNFKDVTHRLVFAWSSLKLLVVNELPQI